MTAPVTHVSGINRNPCVRNGPQRFGALGGIRTPDPQIRSLVLYPAELRALKCHREDAQHTVQSPIWKSRRPILPLTIDFHPCYEGRATTT